MEEQIKPGDVVQFRGGGSPMNVEQVEGAEAICVFSLGGKQRVKLALLEKISNEPPLARHRWTHTRGQIT